MIKRWLPFMTLIILVLFFAVYLAYSGQKSAYTPRTDQPPKIYSEACQSCHGKRGNGSGMIYPSLRDIRLSRKKIGKIISEGALFMPAFDKIKGDTLRGLVDFIYLKRFLTNKKAIKYDGFEQR